MPETSIDPEGFVTGPHRVDTPHPGLVDALTDLWGRVTVAGGAVGFGPASSVDDVRAIAEELVNEVQQRRAHLMTIGQAHVLVGATVLVPGRLPVDQHTGELRWLLVDPALRGAGWGKQLHDAALIQAQAQGLAKLQARVRGEQGLERFFEGYDWVERGRWPGAVRVDPSDERDEVWFTRDV